MKTRLRKTPLFLIFFGLILLAGGVFFGLREYTIITSGQAVPATVIHLLESENSDGKKFWRPEFQYEISGTYFTYRPGYRLSHPRYRVGDTTTLYVSEQGVSMKEINPGFVGIGIAILSGFSFSLIGILWMFRQRKRYDSTVRLKRYGKKIAARFLYEEPTLYTLDDETGYILYFKEEKGERVFESKPVFSDLTIRKLEEHIFDVYVDQKNPQKYYVDIEKHFGSLRPHRK